MKYRPEIDGLRSVAVLPVILYHAGFSAFGGGFTGVDVFFVISGYLITTILIQDLQQGRFSILHFYERRARRILPALTFVILCCLPFAWAWMVPSQLREFGQALVAVAFFASNIYFLRQAGYFKPAADENVLLHTWSLAVEEQYYIFFPLLLMALWRFRQWYLVAVIGGLACLSLAASEWSWRNVPDANFYLIPTRAWELFAGSLCAFILNARGQQSQNLLAAAGVCLIAYAIFAYDKTVPFPSLYSLVPVGGTVLVILFAGQGTLVARVLSRGPVVGIGLVSYSAYLWHQPLFAFAHIRSIYPLQTWHLLALSMLSLGLAYFSWRFVEQPFRQKSGSFFASRARIFTASAVALLAMIAVGGYLHVSKGVPDRPVAALTQPLIDQQFETNRSYRLIRNPGLREDRLAAYLAPTGGMRILVLGDSHGKDIFNAVVQNLDLYTRAAVLSRNLPTDCEARADDGTAADRFTRCAERFMAENSEVFAATTHVIYSMRWHVKDLSFDALSGFVPRYAAEGKTQIVLSNTAEFAPEAPDLIRIAAHEAGYGPGAVFPKQSTDAMFYRHLDADVFAFNARLRALVETDLQVAYFDKLSAICDEATQSCESVTDTGQAIYYDYGHWTLEGARYLGERMVRKDWLSLF